MNNNEQIDISKQVYSDKEANGDYTFAFMKYCFALCAIGFLLYVAPNSGPIGEMTEGAAYGAWFFSACAFLMMLRSLYKWLSN